MSDIGAAITREATVWCAGCEEWHQESAYSVVKFRRRIKKMGWKRNGDKWLCPICQESEGE